MTTPAPSQPVVESAPARMRAVRQLAYGPATCLRLESVPRPEPGPGEVLVKVRAASVNRGDWHLMVGTPYLLRVMGFGLRRPRWTVPGQYLAGKVEGRGAGVEGPDVGDEVYGFGHGTYAEYACVRADALAPMPRNVSPAQAAAMPHGGFAALQALRDAGRLQAGQRVLVLGASGAVGSFAVPLAKAMGAHVTGVCSAGKAEWVRGLGADRVLDHATDDFAAGDPFDLILDLVGVRPAGHLRRALTPRGRCVLVSGGEGRWLGGMGRVLWAGLRSSFAAKKLVPFLAQPEREDLLQLTARVEAEEVVVPVGRVCPLAEIAEAFTLLESRALCGGIVVAP